MITNILFTKGYERGYLPKGDSAMMQQIFATANLAIRKEALKEIGLFDINCKTGEDVDLSIRLSKTKWELFFEPKAVIKHKHRTTLFALLRQWYRYGKYHPYIFKKHTSRCIKIYYPAIKGTGWSSVQFSSFFGFPLPFHMLAFITPFHVLNMFFILAIFSLMMKLHFFYEVILLSWLMIWLYFSMRYFLFGFDLKKISRRILYSLLRYILNWAYVMGAFLGGLKIGVIYIEATRERTPST